MNKPELTEQAFNDFDANLNEVADAIFDMTAAQIVPESLKNHLTEPNLYCMLIAAHLPRIIFDRYSTRKKTDLEQMIYDTASVIESSVVFDRFLRLSSCLPADHRKPKDQEAMDAEMFVNILVQSLFQASKLTKHTAPTYKQHLIQKSVAQITPKE